MEKLVANLANQVQRKRLQGRDYLVAPVSMIVEGVLAGSEGPLLYEGSEIQKAIPAWNARPITIGHPETPSGSKISGCTAEALEKYGVGMVLNTRFNVKAKKQKAEAWFDEERLKTVPGGDIILAALSANTKVEVSTGLFVDKVPVTNGNYNGKPYTHRAVNFCPDHLAILLNEPGACSIADGAGLLVNAQNSELQNSEAEKSAVILEGDLIKPEKKPANSPVTNKASSMTRDELIAALGESHKEFVANMSDEQVTAVAALRVSVATETKTEPVTQHTVAPVANSLEEAVAMVPVALQAQIQEAVFASNRLRSEFAAKVVANKHSTFSQEELNAMPLAQLEKLSVLAANSVAPEGKAPIYMGGGAPLTANSKTTESGFTIPSTFGAK